MDIKKLQAIVVDALEDVKGQEIMLFDTTGLTSLFDRIAVVSGTSNRQTKALAASVRDKVKESGGEIVGMEGEDTGEWVLVDLGDMIVHIMQPAIRQYYRLEEIWGEKPVKLGAAKRKSTPEAIEASEPKVKSKHLAANQAAPEVKPVNERKPAAKRATTAKASDTIGQPAAKKAPAKRAATKAVGKTITVAPSRTEIAAVEATKAKPPKRKVAASASTAAAAADAPAAAPVKRVIKRVAKKADE